MGNLSDFDVDNAGSAPKPPLAGHYQIKLVAHEEKATDRGSFDQLTWQIIGAPPELASEIGKRVYEPLYQYSSVYAKQYATIGLACGIYTKAYLKSIQQKGADLPAPNFAEWMYSTCVCRVKHEPNKNDPALVYAKIGFNYYPNDSEVTREAGVVLGEAGKAPKAQATNSAADVF